MGTFLISLISGDRDKHRPASWLDVAVEMKDLLPGTPHHLPVTDRNHLPQAFRLSIPSKSHTDMGLCGLSPTGPGLALILFNWPAHEL